ncbi:MAG: DUF2934 domain-containing protein [Terracidiphilus sp.]|nr:DUF2934 domain-containing protein [Terracidiphilus sp.]MDR3775980.1 DUF2934 domain-containing protein [Terracidiphilus sp.]
MITPKVRKQSKAKKVVVSERSHAKAAVKSQAGASQELVRARAYEIYESRGNENGQDKQDWFHAEQEILAI